MVTTKTPLEITRELVQIETMNPPGREYECARYVGKLLQDAGLQVSYHQFAEGRTSVVGLRVEAGRPPHLFRRSSRYRAAWRQGLELGSLRG
jgi:acetylornithine deacetylase/succinyl-diaminopimelate desuccinylase-like protein